MSGPFTTAALDASTWPAFADLVERSGGVWGGCWCMAFHEEGVHRGTTPEQNRAAKQARVCDRRAHAALVMDGGECVGWCQFGSPAELPRIKARRAYEAAGIDPASWRITCFFADTTRRHVGVATTALAGALEQIARLGGGRVESYPEDTTDRKVSSSFLHNGTIRMFEEQGFERVARIGKNRWVVAREVTGASPRRASSPAP